MQGVVYKITNKINGKSYIGQTLNLNKRLRDHRYSAKHLYPSNAGQPIVKAIREFGFENFDVDVLFTSEVFEDKRELKKLLHEKEMYFIEKHDTINNGYNVTKGGAGTKGLKLSAEKIELLRRINLGKKFGDVFKERARQRLLNLWKDESFRKMRSEATSGKNNPMYGVRLVGEKNHNFGKPMSEDVKRKISEARRGKGHPSTPETNKKISEALKGIKRSEETRAKIRAAVLGKPNIKRRKIVLQYTMDGEFVKEWCGVSEAEKQLGVCKVGDCALGKRRHAGGFVWKYKKDEN